jgi:hypothetical protein
MKFLFASLLFLFSIVSGFAQNSKQIGADSDKYNLEQVKTYKSRTFYNLDLSQVNENTRTRLIDNLYRSQNIIVTSRLDSDLNLKISALSEVTFSAIKNEIDQLISAINSSPAAAPNKF